MVSVSFSEESSEPTQGLEFARKQLEKHGWSKGKGLGKDENGIANAIKVGIKNDTSGVGFDVGKEFTFHWWDHMFNKAASNIVVEASESGIKVCKKSTPSVDVSRPKKYWRVKGQQLYYGRFVKATSDDNEKTNLKTQESDAVTVLTDEELLKACGGRTAHKSARHGHKLNGKLKRIADQEITRQPEENVSHAIKHDNVEAMVVCVSKLKKKKKKHRKECVLQNEEDKRNKSSTSSALIEASQVDSCNSGDCKEYTEDLSGGIETVVHVKKCRPDGAKGRQKRKRKRKDKEERKKHDLLGTEQGNDAEAGQNQNKSRKHRDVDTGTENDDYEDDKNAKKEEKIKKLDKSKKKRKANKSRKKKTKGPRKE